jgi:chaperone BCS1
MSNQTDHLPGTTTTGQDAGSSEHGFAVSTLMSLFSTSGPSGDWFKLLVIGGFLEIMRRFFLFVWRSLVNQFWITIVLEEYDDSYCESDLLLCHLAKSLISRDPAAWMMLWLSKQPAWTRAKELSISSRSFGVGARAVLVEGEADDNSQCLIRFLPSHDCPASLWYRGHYVRLLRSQVPDGPFYTKEILTIRLVIPPLPRLSPALTLGC